MMPSFFPYLGGKTAITELLIRSFPKHDVYVEGFGGSAELLLSKYRSKIECYNDINGDLVNLFLVTRDNLGELTEHLDWLPHSRLLYETWKTEFRNGIFPPDKIERAARFYYILTIQFAGKMWGGWGYQRQGYGTRWNVRRIKRLKAIHNRLQNVHIECSDFRKLLDAWDGENTFFYLDPPYLEMTGYDQGFKRQDHVDLADKLNELHGKWLLTVNNHPLMYKLYNDFEILEVKQRLAAEKKEKGEVRGEFTNLLIRNYDLKDKSQTLLGGYLTMPPVSVSMIFNSNEDVVVPPKEVTK